MRPTEGIDGSHRLRVKTGRDRGVDASVTTVGERQFGGRPSRPHEPRGDMRGHLRRGETPFELVGSDQRVHRVTVPRLQ